MHWRAELADARERAGHFYAAAGEWRFAREHYGKAANIWRTWTQFGTSNSYRLRRERETADLLAQAEIRLAKTVSLFFDCFRRNHRGGKGAAVS